MSKTWDEAVATVELRRSNDSPLKRAMIEVRDRINGDYVIPMPDVKGEPALAPMGPAVIVDAIEGPAMRANTTRPAISVPALEPGKTSDGAGSPAFAARRRRLYYGTWHYSAMDLMMGRAYRHLGGYGEMGMTTCWDFENGRAKIELRDPLTTYAAPQAPEDVAEPADVGFIYGKSAAFIRGAYGDVPGVRDMMEKADAGDALWDILEWIDESNIYIGLLGQRRQFTSSVWGERNVGANAKLLRAWPNRAGMTPAAVGARVTLDKIASTVSRIIGSTDLMDRLTNLDIVAAERAVFPDRYVIGQDGRTPTLVKGKWVDGRTGQTNVILDAQQVGQLTGGPTQVTGQTIGMIERNARGATGASALFGGEVSGSLRSGQTVNALGAMSIDPRIQEMQMIMERKLATINTAVHETTKGYLKGKMIFFSGWPSDTGHTEIEAKHLESKENVVNYPFPGASVSEITVALAQLVGTKMMSRKTARRKHPMIEDAELEEHDSQLETLLEAMEQGYFTQVASGAIPMIAAGDAYEAISQGKSLVEATRIADEKARKLQAAQAPSPEEGMSQAPQAMPGLSMPGMGAESQPPEEIVTNAGPNGDQENFRMLARALRGGVRT